MKYLDLTLPSPEANLAMDEALLDAAEETGATEVLRVWEAPSSFVVVGRANQVAKEVNREACHALGIPLLRRSSGGGAVVQAPGCLNYALILRIDPTGQTESIPATNDFVMRKHAQTVQELLGSPVSVRGHTDLVLGERKFSGNAQRRKRQFLLFHGTFLLQMDLDLIELLLPMPSHEPDYRQKRSHHQFLMNIPVAADSLKHALAQAWGANVLLPKLPSRRAEQLVQERYSREEWNFRL